MERVQEISEPDVVAEGIRYHEPSGYWLGRAHEIKGTPKCHPTAHVAFQDLWDETNAHRPEFSWANNPWVWAVSFRVVDASTLGGSE